MRVVRPSWLVLAVLGGCSGTGSFVCADDPSCSGGVCQANGYCSFDDDGCPSGQRYGAHSPSGIAGECVAPGEGETTGDTSGAPTSNPTVTLDPTSTTLPVAESSGTTMPMSETTPTHEDSSSSSSGGGSTGLVETCAHEDFEDEILDDWSTWADAPTLAEIVDGAFTVHLANIPSYGGLDPLWTGVEDGSLEIQMREAPVQVEGTQVFLGIGVDDESYLLLLEYGTLVVRHDLGDGYEDLVVVDWEPEALWMRIEIDDGDLEFFRSSDGVSWLSIFAVTPGFALEVAQPFLHAGTWELVGLDPGRAVFERVSTCWYE